jgi:hypothetical protein
MLGSVVYVVTGDAKKGSIAVEGKALRSWECTFVSTNTLRLNKGTGKGYVLGDGAVDPKQMQDAMELKNPPEFLRFSESFPEKLAALKGKNYLALEGVFADSDFALPVKRIGLDTKVNLPFEVKVDGKLEIKGTSGVAEGAWDPMAINLTSKSRPQGTLKTCTIENTQLELVDLNMRDGVLKTKQFGDIEVVVEGQLQFSMIGTVKQMRDIRQWLGTYRRTSN